MNFLPFHIIAAQPALFLMAELVIYLIIQEEITWISRRSGLSSPIEEKS